MGKFNDPHGQVMPPPGVGLAHPIPSIGIFEGDTILFGQVDFPAEPRHNPDKRHPTTGTDGLQTGLQKLRITAKLVDDKAFDQVPFRLLKKLHGSHQGSKNATFIDIADQQNRSIYPGGEPHVDDILVAQVNFGRAPRTLDNNQFILPAQTFQAGGHRLPGGLLVIVVSCRRHVTDRLAMNNNLGPDITIGFYQHRVHISLGS